MFFYRSRQPNISVLVNVWICKHDVKNVNFRLCRACTRKPPYNALHDILNDRNCTKIGHVYHSFFTYPFISQVPEIIL